MTWQAMSARPYVEGVKEEVPGAIGGDGGDFEGEGPAPAPDDSADGPAAAPSAAR